MLSPVKYNYVPEICSDFHFVIASCLITPQNIPHNNLAKPVFFFFVLVDLFSPYGGRKRESKPRIPQYYFQLLIELHSEYCMLLLVVFLSV
jgi:hypothetical protein